MSDPISQPEASSPPVVPGLVRRGASSPDERRDPANTSSRFHAMANKDWISGEFDPNLHQVLKVLITARTPLSAQSISDLTGMDTARVAQAVSTLQDFLDVDEAGLLHTTDPSLRDYLTNLACCGSGSPWYIDVEQAECELASQLAANPARDLHLEVAAV
ncbi:hypothetical protein C8R46DRAFT_1252782 [Mycena filopes]|nr:hypothetical protein C8R46DRAFT_1252782 [Mycena filopes]